MSSAHFAWSSNTFDVVAFDRALGLLRRDVIILAIDEQHDVGVLLDRSRFAQIRQLRALVLALSTARLSCDSASTGTFRSLASVFSPRLISEISCTRLSLDARPLPVSNWR